MPYDMNPFQEKIKQIEKEADRNRQSMEQEQSRMDTISQTLLGIREDAEVFRLVDQVKEESKQQLNQMAMERSELSSRLISVQTELEAMYSDTREEYAQLGNLRKLGEDISESDGILNQRMDDIASKMRWITTIRDQYGLEGETPELDGRLQSGSFSTSYENLSDYLNAHNYRQQDYETYSQDIHWRMLMEKEFPDAPLPDFKPDNAKRQLTNYMHEHNYGSEDYYIYSKDPVWQELNKAAFPEIPFTVRETPEYLKDWRMMEKHVPMEETLKAINPNYYKGDEWQNNCQRCSAAYEMRRRGYDITAKPAALWDAHNPNSLSYKPFSAWENPEIQHCRFDDRSEIEHKMREWGDGARAEIVVRWAGTPDGHAFIAEQINGKTVFLDPQNGRADAGSYFQDIQRGKTQFCRIDQLTPSKRILECCREV